MQNTIVYILVGALLLAVLIYLLFGGCREGFCNDNSDSKVIFTAQNPIVSNDFFPEIPLYNVGTNKTDFNCQTRSIKLVNQVGQNKMSQQQANKEWIRSKCA